MLIYEDDLLGISDDLKKEIMENTEALNRASVVVSKFDDIARKEGYATGYMGFVTEISNSASCLEKLLKKAMVETPYQSTREDIMEALKTVKSVNRVMTDNKNSMIDNFSQELFDDDGLRKFVLS